MLQNSVAVTVGAGSTQVLGPNIKRKSVIISAGNAARITIAFGRPAVLDAGVTLPAAGAPLLLTTGHIGDAITEDINAISPAGGVTIGATEFFEP